MTALIIYGLLAVLVAVAVVALVVVVLPDDTLAPAVRDTVPSGLPPRPDIGADDVSRLRLPVGLRGYRMVDTDAVLDRLGSEIERRDREIAALRVTLAATRAGGPDDGVAPAPAAVPAPAEPTAPIVAGPATEQLTEPEGGGGR